MAGGQPAPGLMLGTGNQPRQEFSGGAFRQWISPDLYFTSNVPNGMAGHMAVELSVPQEAAHRLVSADEEEIPFEGNLSVTIPGSYRLYAHNPHTFEEYIFSFTVLPEFSNHFEAFTAPLGYSVNSFSRDGEALPVGQQLFFEEDGQYIIQLSGQPGWPPLTVSITLDTVTPTLTITGIENGVATGSEVTLSSDMPNTVITVLRNGSDINFRGGAITASGSYVVTITDRAGNYAVYEFTIPNRLNTTAILFIVLIALILAGGAFYLLRVRKNAKV